MDIEGWRLRRRKAKVSKSAGDAIRGFRQSRGLSQARLAKTINMGEPYWSKTENDRKGPPRLGTLKKVVEAFRRVGKPLTDLELLELFKSALANVDLRDALADVRYET